MALLQCDDEALFVQKIQQHLSGKLRGETMTLAQRFEQKGREQGKLEVAEHLLSEGIELKVVEKTTGIAIEKLIALQKKIKGDSH